MQVHQRGNNGAMSLRHSAILLISLALAGCSSNLLGGGSGPSVEQNIPVGNQLALPPDLSLRAPSATTPTYRANPAPGVSDAAVYSDDINTPINRQAALPKATTTDPYEKYGISKLKPDGSKKDEGVLREELRQAALAEKRKTNPGYGTIRNIGELFKD
jgi:hypothetical protein